MPHAFTSVIIIMNIQSNVLVLKFFQQSVFAATKGSKHLFSAIFFLLLLLYDVKESGYA